jgi:16S rRNA (cytidine1402-2'-O)-methyltransferase
MTKEDSKPPVTAPNLALSRAASALEVELAKPLRDGLYLVSTPIGNLADISLRALSTLTRADLIFCEDTRHSRKLLSHYGISGELHAYHEHNASRERPRIIARLRAGQSIALISDAGTPLISDPGHKLVREVREAGLAVHAIPGASALLAALTISGLPTDRFFFEGFLPPKTTARRKRLEELRDIPATLVFYEAPQRVQAMLLDVSEVLGRREGAIAKELTKLHENVMRGSFAELAAEAADKLGEKGEFVVLAGPAPPSEVSDDDIVSRLEIALGESTFRDGVQNVTDMLGVPRKRVYQLALALKDQTGTGSQ